MQTPEGGHKLIKLVAKFPKQTLFQSISNEILKLS